MQITQERSGERLNAHTPPPLHKLPAALWKVTLWELRRAFAQPAAYILLVILMMLVFFASLNGFNSPGSIQPAPGAFSVIANPTSVMAMFWFGGWLLISVLPMLSIFLVGDGVCRDLHRRSHELLMSTQIPTLAYIWGRYLAGLLVALMLYLSMFAGWLAAAIWLWLAAGKSAPNLPGLFAGLGFLLLPPVLLLSALAFVLCTWLPRCATLWKAGLLLAWLVTLMIPFGGQQATLDEIAHNSWNVNNTQTAFVIFLEYGSRTGNAPQIAQLTGYHSQYQPDGGLKYFDLNGQPLPDDTPAQMDDSKKEAIIAAMPGVLAAEEQKLPDLSSWWGKRLIYFGIAFGLVVVSGLTFKRFRRQIG